MKINITTNFNLGKLDMWRVNQIGLVNSSQELQRIAQENAPYDTGKLKQGIGVEPANITKSTKLVRVGPRGIVYGPRREFENFKNPHKKYYMRRTHDVAKNIVQNEFEKAVVMAINSIKK